MKSTTLSRLAVAAAVSGAMVASSAALADTFTASATVSNTITLTETQALNFGTLYAVSSAGVGDSEGLTMSPTGVMSNDAAGTLAKLVSLGGQTPGIISISGLAAFTNVTITSAPTTNLIHSSGNPAIAIFTLSTVTDDTAGTVTTDANGAATINVGATINTEVTANAYQDGIYNGSYDVTAAF